MTDGRWDPEEMEEERKRLAELKREAIDEVCDAVKDWLNNNSSGTLRIVVEPCSPVSEIRLIQDEKVLEVRYEV